MTKFQAISRFRTISVLLAGSALVSAMPALAQAGEGGESVESAAVADIVVTGTRIVRDGYNAPTPVTVATVEELACGFRRCRPPIPI